MALSPPAILNTVTATLIPVEYLTRAASLFTNGTGAIFLCVCARFANQLITAHK